MTTDAGIGFQPAVESDIDGLKTMLLTLISSTPIEGGIGHVSLGRHRYRSDEQFYQYMVQQLGDSETGLIKGWELFWGGGGDARGGGNTGAPIGQLLRHHAFQLNGYMSYDDDYETERMFDRMNSAILDQLAANVQPPWRNKDGLTVRISPGESSTSLREWFGGVGVLLTEIQFAVSEFIKLPAPYLRVPTVGG